VKADEARGDAPGGDGLLARVDIGEQVDFDTAGEVKAAGDGGLDEGCLFDMDQGVSPCRAQ
jgi:hypothetical protein